MFPDNSSLVDLRPLPNERARGSCPDDDYILICVECTSLPLSLSNAAEATMKFPYNRMILVIVGIHLTVLNRQPSRTDLVSPSVLKARSLERG